MRRLAGILAIGLLAVACSRGGAGAPRRTKVPIDPIVPNFTLPPTPEKVFDDDGSVPGSAIAPLQALDGTVLLGRVFDPGETTGVILVHGANATQEVWYKFAQRLADAGITALTFDLRGYGRSEGGKDARTAPEDIELAAEYLDSVDAKRIAVIGVGLGGTAAVVQAAKTDFPVRAIAAIDAGPVDEDLDARSEARRVRVQALVVSTGDPKAAELAGLIPDARLERLPGTLGPGDARLQDVLLAFVKKALRS